MKNNFAFGEARENCITSIVMSSLFLTSETLLGAMETPLGAMVNFWREGEWARRSSIKSNSGLDPCKSVISTSSNWFNVQSRQFEDFKWFNAGPSSTRGSWNRIKVFTIQLFLYHITKIKNKKNTPPVSSKVVQDLVSSEANKEHHEVDSNHQLEKTATSNVLNYSPDVEATLEYFPQINTVRWTLDLF